MANCTIGQGAMNGSTAEGAQGICATGWHIPSDGDWKTLEGELGMSTADQDNPGFRGTDQGTQLKIGGDSGFEARLAGVRATGGSVDRDSTANLWSSTEVGASAWGRFLFSGSARVSRDSFSKSFGFSVWCLKD
ncbi:fibrobacter succinogenes major paralogous domain-containing protein [Isorropodon fossajaponicum symbiont]|uniref:fibrobacter succinogenes major paralogous domain-containing protein n=1 Tax=Isorropodon fossajaponicum symbiont TaxID=883811 RepID=UPI00191593C5|nr:fibrobacter succinogenes major paralogous domain-containing protein [Isorropodon fossajaponicum symbiont]